MTFGPKFTELHSATKERQLQKSCVSFGEECTVDLETLEPHIISSKALEPDSYMDSYS